MFFPFHDHYLKSVNSHRIVRSAFFLLKINAFARLYIFNYISPFILIALSNFNILKDKVLELKIVEL